jgi:hypothetical protein
VWDCAGCVSIYIGGARRAVWHGMDFGDWGARDVARRKGRGTGEYGGE